MQLRCVTSFFFFYIGVRHPGLETFLKNTTSAIKANTTFLNPPNKPGGAGEENNNQKSSKWYSIFPVENTELVYGDWEDKIIWDSQVFVFYSNFSNDIHELHISIWFLEIH